MIKPIIKWMDNLVFTLTGVLFSFIPVAMMLGGSFLPLLILLSWFFNQRINLFDIWYIILGLVVAWMGFKWDDVIIESYPDAIVRKKNNEKHNSNNQ